MTVEDDFPCTRCEHSPYHHRLDDGTNVSPVDPEAEFRCTWPQLRRPDEGTGTVADCACPDYVAPQGFAEWIASRG